MKPSGPFSLAMDGKDTTALEAAEFTFNLVSASHEML